MSLKCKLENLKKHFIGNKFWLQKIRAVVWRVNWRVMFGVLNILKRLCLAPRIYGNYRFSIGLEVRKVLPSNL